MENAVVAIIVVAIILGSCLTLALALFPSVDTLSTTWKDVTDRSMEAQRTSITTDNSSISDEGTMLRVNVMNDGQVSLRDYDNWDIIITYTSDSGTSIRWLPYTTDEPLGDNQWTVANIFFNGGTEAIEPDILNPGEYMAVVMKLNPGIDTDTTNSIVITTPNGVTSRLIFSGGGF